MGGRIRTCIPAILRLSVLVRPFLGILSVHRCLDLEREGTVEDVPTSLAGARQGDSEALGHLFSELYRDLRKLAHARLKRHGTCTLLDTTALVHESSVGSRTGAGAP